MKRKLHHSKFSDEEMALLTLIEMFMQNDYIRIIDEKYANDRISCLFLWHKSEQGREFWSEYNKSNRNCHVHFL